VINRCWPCDVERPVSLWQWPQYLATSCVEYIYKQNLSTTPLQDIAKIIFLLLHPCSLISDAPTPIPIVLALVEAMASSFALYEEPSTPELVFLLTFVCPILSSQPDNAVLRGLVVTHLLVPVSYEEQMISTIKILNAITKGQAPSSTEGNIEAIVPGSHSVVNTQPDDQSGKASFCACFPFSWFRKKDYLADQPQRAAQTVGASGPASSSG